MSINNDAQPFFVASWFNEAANETTFTLNLQTPQERGFALWPMGKIIVCRLTAASTALIATITSLVLFVIAAQIFCALTFPALAGLYSLIVGFISIVFIDPPDPMTDIYIQEVALPLFAMMASITFIFLMTMRKYETEALDKLCNTWDDSLKNNISGTLNTIAEIYHGANALLFGYTTTRIFNAKQLESMKDGATLREFFKKVKPNYAFNNGTAFEWHKEIVLAKGKDLGAIYSSLSNKYMDTQDKFEVELSDESMHALRLFMYLGIEPTNRTAIALLFFADKYAYTELKNICLRIIKNEIDRENLEIILSFANEYEIYKFKAICFDFIFKSGECKAIIEKLKLEDEYKKFTVNPIVSFDPIPNEINDDFADIEFITSDKQKVKAHQIMLQLKWNIEFKDPRAVKNGILISKDLSKFTKETIEDFLNIIYFKKMPRFDPTQDLFTLDRLDNLCQLIKSIESPEFKNEFMLLRDSYLFEILTIIQNEQKFEIIDKNEAIRRILIVQEFAHLHGISQVINQCVQMHIERDSNGDFSKDIYHLTELKVLDDNEKKVREKLNKILFANGKTALTCIETIHTLYAYELHSELFRKLPTLKFVKANYSTYERPSDLGPGL